MDGVDQTAREGLARLEKELDKRVLHGIYEAEQNGLKARVAEVEKDNISLEAKVDKGEERRASDRRLILTSLVLPLLLALILLYVQSQIGAR